MLSIFYRLALSLFEPESSIKPKTYPNWLQIFLNLVLWVWAKSKKDQMKKSSLLHLYCFLPIPFHH